MSDGVDILKFGDKSHIKVNGISYEIIKVFTVLFEGWELDYRGYIVNDDGKNRIVLTTHNKPYFADISDLSRYIETYKKVIKEMEEVIKMVGE